MKNPPQNTSDQLYISEMCIYCNKMLTIDYFDLVVFAVDCVVSRTVHLVSCMKGREILMHTERERERERERLFHIFSSF